MHLFYLFWIAFFLVETNDFIISGTATGWYFEQEKPFSDSFTRYRKFHIGSVCAGSFLLALLGFIKFLYDVLTVAIALFRQMSPRRRVAWASGPNFVTASVTAVCSGCSTA